MWTVRVVRSIYFGGCKKNIVCGKTAEFLMLNQVEGIVTTLLESLIPCFSSVHATSM
jgi:hypothetical protein